MYLFENCPFHVEPRNSESACFDPGSLDIYKRHPDIVRRYCEGDFRGCPYYRTNGIPSRIPEEAKPRAFSGARRRARSLL